MTTMPRCVAAGTSMLSTPIPARPMTLSFSARANSVLVTLVAERTASPSYPAMRASSSSAERPGNKSTAIPRAAKTSAARGLRTSEINTFGIVGSVRI
jgi:hypothetical protein